MNVHPNTSFGTFESVNESTRRALSRLAKVGRALRLAPGLYAVGATVAPEQAARHHLFAIINHTWPGATICGRTALAGGVPVDSLMFVTPSIDSHDDSRTTASSRRTALVLPGVTVIPVPGPGPLPGDMAFPQGLSVSGAARVLIENVDTPGRPANWRAGTEAVENRIDDIARSGGSGRILAVLNELDVIKGLFDQAAVNAIRSRLVAVLGSFTDTGEFSSPRLNARLAGVPYDSARIAMLDRLIESISARAPRPMLEVVPTSRWEWLPFFEAYFSNFIEGTEFGVEEARRISVDGLVPEGRPADAHDVSATYQLARDPYDRSTVPADGNQLLAILLERHGILMAARPDMHPGEFKTRLNFAGGYQFVAPNLVEGTLLRGFDKMKQLIDPFARAVAMMVLITECHPFDDGNGRIARLMVNAELSSAGQVRICIPTVYRNDYLNSLTGFSNGAGAGESLTAVLEFAQRWTAAIDWSTYEGASEMLNTTNAFLDPGVADRTFQRLVLPQRH